VLPSTVRARPGRSSAVSISHSKSVLYSNFVRVRRALNRQKRRFPSRAAPEGALSSLDPGLLAQGGQGGRPSWPHDSIGFPPVFLLNLHAIFLVEGTYRRPPRLIGSYHPSEKNAKLAQKLSQPQPVVAAFPQECMGQLASSGPT
jgi:hypothetical protein